jgi:hypothetical protein
MDAEFNEMEETEPFGSPVEAVPLVVAKRRVPIVKTLNN